MIRTHIYITEEQARDIKVRTKRERRRESDVARMLPGSCSERGRFISQGRKQESLGDALLRLAEVGKKSPYSQAHQPLKPPPLKNSFKVRDAGTRGRGAPAIRSAV